MNQTADSAAPRVPPSASTEGMPAPSVPATGSRDTPRDHVPGHVRGPGRTAMARDPVAFQLRGPILVVALATAEGSGVASGTLR